MFLKVICLHRGGTELREERKKRADIRSCSGTCAHCGHTHIQHSARNEALQDGWEALEYLALPSYLGRCPQCRIHSSCLSPCLLPVLPNQHVYVVLPELCSECLLSVIRPSNRQGRSPVLRTHTRPWGFCVPIPACVK